MGPGARGHGCSWSRRTQVRACPPSGSPVPPCMWPASFLHLTLCHTQSSFTPEERLSVLCQAGHLSPCFRLLLSPASASPPHRGCPHMWNMESTQPLEPGLGVFRPCNSQHKIHPCVAYPPAPNMGCTPVGVSEPTKPCLNREGRWGQATPPGPVGTSGLC